jgi:vacuolar-type H+-ATPase subunit H
VTDFVDHGATLEVPATPRSGARGLAGLGQRLAQTFSRAEDADTGALQPTEQYSAPWQDDMPRFAVVRHGYHCAAVDQYVAELEQELGELDREVAQLRTQPPQAQQPTPAAPGTAADEVAAEIKRVGEQTSAVLIAAHEQAQERIREADEEAERRLAEAKAEASGIITRANQRLHELEMEMQGVQSDRERLLADVRSAATALTELVDVSLTRFPPHEDGPIAALDEPDPEEAAPEEAATQATTDSPPVPA